MCVALRIVEAYKRAGIKILAGLRLEKKQINNGGKSFRWFAFLVGFVQSVAFSSQFRLARLFCTAASFELCWLVKICAFILCPSEGRVKRLWLGRKVKFNCLMSWMNFFFSIALLHSRVRLS